MIYLCEYDGFLDREALLLAAVRLPLPQLLEPASEIRWKKYRERILAWLLLEYALAQEAGQRPAKAPVLVSEKMLAAALFAEGGTLGGRIARLEIVRTEHGKPYSSAASDCFFNLSHCETACACILDCVPCGIDVERRFAYRDSLYRKVCHPQERALLDGLSQEERREQFCLLWSLKESYVKLDGRGLGYKMNSLNLAGLLPGPKKGVLEIDFAKTAFYSETAPAYTLAACRRTGV